MSEAYSVITPPSVEPVTLTKVKSWLNVDFSSKDTEITGLITRARAHCEKITGRAFATQKIREIITIERPVGGTLSGPIGPDPSWYQFNESLGANPFGPAQFYFDIAFPPIQVSEDLPLVVSTKVYAFSPWETFATVTDTEATSSVWLDTTQEPARLYIASPVTANMYKLEYWAGYSTSYPLPGDLLEPLLELCSYWYDYRDGGGDKNRLCQINDKLLSRRTADAWI